MDKGEVCYQGRSWNRSVVAVSLLEEVVEIAMVRSLDGPYAGRGRWCPEKSLAGDNTPAKRLAAGLGKVCSGFRGSSSSQEIGIFGQRLRAPIRLYQ